MKPESCTICDLPFIPTSKTFTVCIVCWKKEKGYRNTAGDKAFSALQQYVQDHQGTEEKLKAKNRELKRLRQRVRDLEAREVQQEATENPNSLTKTQIMALLKLVHPDRHGNSELANQATRWLLSMKR